MIVADNFKLVTLPLAVTAAGPIGTAALTVDIASSFNITYTGVVDGVVTVPVPTDAQAGDIVKIVNVDTVSFMLGGDSLAPGFHTYLHWTGTAWSFTDGGRNSGALVSVALVPAGTLLVTHNLGMPSGSFSRLIYQCHNTLPLGQASKVELRRNKSADTANAMAFSIPVAITTNLPLVFDFTPTI